MISAILRRSESSLQQALIRCDVNHRSPVNGICAMHFAVTWPTALRTLIIAGADVNVEDHIGRRPIELSVALGAVEAVQLLIEADCSLFTAESHRGLLKECLLFEEGEKRGRILGLIVQALIDRHTRLLNWILSVLTPSSGLYSKIIPGQLQQSLLPEMYEEIRRQGHECPAALELDFKGHYQTGDLHSEIRIPISTAEQLWNGGFQELEEPYDVCGPALTPILEAWYNADFDILQWLITKGASPFSKHAQTGGSGLHMFAHRLQYPGFYFQHEISGVPSDTVRMTELMSDESAWRDSCSCLCSTRGCQPVTIFLKGTYLHLQKLKHIRYQLRKFWEKLPPPPGKELLQAEAALRFFAFEQSEARHLASCCSLGQLGERDLSTCLSERWHEAHISAEDLTVERDRQMIEEKMQFFRQKMLYCGCPLLDKPACVVSQDTCPLG